MEVGGEFEVLFDRLHSAFPFVRKPRYAFTDFLGEFGLAQQQMADFSGGNVRSTNIGFEADPIVGAVYPRRVFVPHDNNLVDSIGYGHCYATGYNPGQDIRGYPLVEWEITNQSEGQVIDFPSIAPLDNNWIRCVFDSLNQATVKTNAVVVAKANVCTQGFTLLFRQYVRYNRSQEDVGEIMPYFAIRWQISNPNGGDPRLYSIAFQQGKSILFAYSDDDGETWEEVGEIKAGVDRNTVIQQLTGDSSTQLPAPVEDGPDPVVMADSLAPLALEVRFLGGKMQVWIGNNDVPFVWPDIRYDEEDLIPYWMIDQLQVIATQYDYCSWMAAPSKWLTAARLDSNDQNLGFTPLVEPDYRVHYAPIVAGAAPPSSTEIGWTPQYCFATVETVEIAGTVLRYQLNADNNKTQPAGRYKGDNYADFTTWIRAVTGEFPIDILVRPSNAISVQPEKISVSYDFDYQSLRVTSRGSLLFNNYNGEWSNAFDGGFVEQNGHVAVRIRMGIEGFPLFNRLVGIANTGFREHMLPGGESGVEIMCRDSWMPLDTEVWNLPWMDGWNVYYVLFYLAQLRGVTPERMQFYLDGFVPDQPYGECPNGEPSFFMPVGPAGSPLTRFGNGQKVSAIIVKIAYSLGYLVFFDVNSVMQFYKFDPYGGPFKRTFTYVPGPEGTLTEIWGAEYAGDTEDIRNQVTVVGVNAFGPIWNPLVAHESDDASIEDDTAFNFVGFPKPIVWMDSLFANLEFAVRAAKALLLFLRVPTRTIQMQTWMQPDVPIYPLDIIAVYNPKSAATFGPKAFLVLGVTDTQEYGCAPMTTIRGRWLPFPGQVMDVVPLVRDGEVALSWAPLAGVISYRIQRSTSSGEVTYTTSLIPSFVDTDVVNGTDYSYQIAGVNLAGEGKYSTQVNAMPVA